MEKVHLAGLKNLEHDRLHCAIVSNTDLVLVRSPDSDEVFVLYGRCQHRGALMSDGHVNGVHLSCCLHGSTYDFRTGKNIHYPGADLQKFELSDLTTWKESMARASGVAFGGVGER